MQQAIKNATLEARRQFRLGVLAGLGIATAVFGVAVYLSAVIYV